MSVWPRVTPRAASRASRRIRVPSRARGVPLSGFRRTSAGSGRTVADSATLTCGNYVCTSVSGMVWLGAPSTPRQCVPVTEGGGFIQHLPDARSLRRAGQSALVRGWVCLCGRWKLHELSAHTAKVIGLEMRRTCNTDASRATGWMASMSSPYVGLPSGLCPGTGHRARASRLALDSGLGAAAVWCTLPVHLVDQRASVRVHT
jgi:hypothetical protein